MKTRNRTLFIICLLIVAGCKDENGITNEPPGNGNGNGNGNMENSPPGAFALTSPQADASDTDIRPVFSWEAATDPDGDTVQYDLFLDTGTDPSTVVASELTETEYTPEDRLSLVTDYSWKVVAKDGEGGETESEVISFTTRALGNAERATDQANFGTLNSHASVVYNDRMWVLGGFDGNDAENDVWFSEDGAAWTEATAGSIDKFTRRFFHDAVVFDNRMWVIGGLTDEGFDNDVWVSEDGATWTEVDQTNEFPVRAEHTVTAFDGRLWVIAGAATGGDKLADVWSSGDGADWQQETADAGFTARNFHQTVAFQDALWVIGGQDGNFEATNDVWRSEGGETWTEVTPAAAFSERIGHRVTAFDSRLWLVGSGTTSDVWFSEDGASWKEITPQVSYPARGDFTSVVHDEKLWIVGGGQRSDVWYIDLN